MTRRRGGTQVIPRPAGARPGGPAPWDKAPLEPDLDRLARLRTALNGHTPRPAHPTGPPDVRAAAVLIPLVLDGDELGVVLTRRASHLRKHTGEVAFPGGAIDEGERPADAARREAQEEVGIEPAAVELLGELDHIATVGSRFTIAPFVGLLAAPPQLRPNDSEIERAFTVPLADLLDPETWREEVWQLPWGEFNMPFFELEGDTVWGATGRILEQLLMLLTGVTRAA
jgi:8-oxo-dGTP pyrophosphatase MutT (NUDIX family)